MPVVLETLGSALIRLDGYLLTVYLCACHRIKDMLLVGFGNFNGCEAVVNVNFAEALSGHSRCINKCTENKIGSKTAGASCGYFKLDGLSLAAPALGSSVPGSGECDVGDILNLARCFHSEKCSGNVLGGQTVFVHKSLDLGAVLFVLSALAA